MIRLLLLLMTAMSFGCELEGGIWNNVVNNFRGQTAPQAPCMRILVEHDVNKACLEITGKYSLHDPYTNSHISSRFAGKCREIEAMNDGLKWGEAFPGLYQIKIIPNEATSRAIVNGKIYDGSIYVYDIGGAISIVNQVPIENYISNLLAEFPDCTFHPEVLAAVAIVARTNAYFITSNPKNDYWFVDANSTNYQGQRPVSYEMNSAIYSTRYMIMSRTGVYDKVTTPFAAQFESQSIGATVKDTEISKISLKEAQIMAEKGAHAAQILAQAFPGSTIMLMNYCN